MHIVIIGGGASGFMGAITAAETNPEARVTLLEKSKTVLSKVRISGGGRCNVTHRPLTPGNFAKNYPRGAAFMKKILPVFGAGETIEWFESRGVKLKTEADGRMFPDTDSSDTIIQCLMNHARKAGVEIRTSRAVSHIHPEGDHFILEIQGAEPIIADRVLVASGGTPKIEGFDWLTALGHEVKPPVPSLFTFNTPGSYLLPLAGISLPDAKIRIPSSGLVSEGPVLITHWGFSGPAVLRLSAWGARELAQKAYQFQIRINWAADTNFDKVRQFLYQLKTSTPRQQLPAHAQFGIPARLWRLFTEKAEIDNTCKLSETSHKSLNKLASLITDSVFEVSGKTTFKEEFVTCGGISLDDIDQATMESKVIKGLYFAGEILDADGVTGGFNFQQAWSTGFIAGRNIVH